MSEKTYTVRLTKAELWELINAADQAASEPDEHLSTGKAKLWDAHAKAKKGQADEQ